VGASEYIKGIRARIGHDLLLMPSVAVLIRSADGDLLLMKSVDTDRWQTIGGAIDPDETPEDAAHREVFEEAGITIEIRGTLAVLGGPQYRVTYPNGDETAYVTIVFDALHIGGEPTPDGEEASELMWWSLDQLERCPMTPLARALLRAARLT
jgi:8-oxo-dGTP pyrophosphatase MutT (NUDIX family)